MYAGRQKRPTVLLEELWQGQGTGEGCGTSDYSSSTICQPGKITHKQVTTASCKPKWPGRGQSGYGRTCMNHDARYCGDHLQMQGARRPHHHKEGTLKGKRLTKKLYLRYTSILVICSFCTVQLYHKMAYYNLCKWSKKLLKINK